MRHKRHEDRNLCADLVLIGWRREKGSRHTEWVTLEDISSGGACLKIEDHIPVDTKVSLQFSKGGCEGIVKYCVPDPTGYLLGVEFSDGYRWSRTKYRPEHIVQFRLRAAPKPD